MITGPIDSHHGVRQGQVEGKAAVHQLQLLADALEDCGRRWEVLLSAWQVLAKGRAGAPADKDKRYLCSVIEFSAMHDFGDGIKGAAFQLKEMGEDGQGSLEPGVASGEEFMIGYPTP